MKLILLRHGQSQWNQKNLFCGWVDADLSEKGIEEAKYAGKLLKKHNILPEVVHTSFLKRAIKTASIALEECDRLYIDALRTWRLNERHYGDFQGKNKKEVLEEYGESQFMIYRRSYDTPPPAIKEDAKYSQSADRRYDFLNKIGGVPLTESLADVEKRIVPYFEEAIKEDILETGCVLVAAHGNSLRALIKYIETVDKDEIAKLNIPTGIPLVYEFDAEFNILSKEYLDPEKASKEADKVAQQGK